ncbi:DUF4173 domain-containing protein [Erythrobacter sp. SG61-1L]|uniref:DUF4153 domain-containing protein n=1 Tax=Erythrobacter sp. SG61-1L TaxID=1603897 RepID=UPI0006C9218C|nr:DUF4173 domain-containing protein [Erythrobacter sp. SG61-1L]
MDFRQPRFRGTFGLKAILTVALVALGDLMFFQQGLHGGAFGLYGLAMLAALALARPAVIGHLRPALVLCLAALYALAMIYNASPLPWLLFWIAAGIATLMPGTVGFDDGWRWFQRLSYHAIVSLIGPPFDFGRRAGANARRGTAPGGLKRLLPVIILPIAGSLVFVGLFAAANPVIENWLASFSGPSVDGWTFLRLALWLLLVWMAWSLMRPHLPRNLLGTFDGRGDLNIPGVSTESVLLSLVVFNGLFLMQNMMDAAWLWGFVPLPDGMTLASYAHRGAYPLIATALLAALFVLVALRPGSTTAGNRSVRVLVVLWIAQNLFLVFNAALRTVDYVEAYSLTVLRISALLWMALVAVGLVLVLWRMFAGKSAAWLINANLGAAGLLLTGVCFVDLGAVAAEWNVRHAREVDGDGAVLDLCYLNGLGGSALVPLIRLEQSDLPDELHQRVRNVRLVVHHRLRDDVQHGGWDVRSRQQLAEASALLGGRIGPRLVDWDYGCDGERLEAYIPPAPSAAAPVPVATETAAAALTGGTER